MLSNELSENLVKLRQLAELFEEPRSYGDFLVYVDVLLNHASSCCMQRRPSP